MTVQVYKNEGLLAVFYNIYKTPLLYKACLHKTSLSLKAELARHISVNVFNNTAYTLIIKVSLVMAIVTVLQLMVLFGSAALAILFSAWLYDRAEALWLATQTSKQPKWESDWQPFPPSASPETKILVTEKVITFKATPSEQSDLCIPKAA
jgi:hypothetical protein